MTPYQISLNDALKKRRMSKAELARRVGVGRASVGKYVAGKATPRREVARKINEALGVEMSPVRSYTAREVAKMLGTTPELLGRGMQGGQFKEIGVAVKSPNGRYRYIFYPAKVREFVGID